MCTKKKKGTMAFPQGQKSPWQKEVKYLEKWTVRLKNEVNQIKFYFIKINNSLLFKKKLSRVDSKVQVAE